MLDLDCGFQCFLRNLKLKIETFSVSLKILVYFTFLLIAHYMFDEMLGFDLKKL